jgi:hypothetical protein
MASNNGLDGYAAKTAARYGIDNTPPLEVLERLKHTALGLEAVRIRLGASIIISSGYRCLELNRRLGSKDSSAHVLGHAADFTCPGFGHPVTVVSALENSGILYDQLIVEFGRWIHISFAPELRGQVLQIDANGTRAFA